MPEYLTPGVYIEEFEIGAKPIEGVSTSTAGFLGVAEKGSTEGLPKLVTSFSDFQRKFGSYLGASYGEYRFLPFAVDNFFVNGGSRCYVMRVVPSDAVAASNVSVLGGVQLQLTQDQKEADSDLYLESLRGIDETSRITLQRLRADGSVEESDDDMDIDSYDISENKITLAAPLPEGSDYPKKFTRVIVTTLADSATPSGSSLGISANSKGDWGENILVRSIPASQARTQITEVIGDSGTTLQYKIKNKNGFYQGAIIAYGNGSNKQYRRVTALNDDIVTLSSHLTGDGDVVDTDADPNRTIATCEFTLQVVYKDQVEIFNNLSMNPDTPNYFMKVVNDRSKYVTLTSPYTDPADFTRNDPFDMPANSTLVEGKLGITLSNGSDGTVSGLTAADFMGADKGPGKRSGIKAFNDIDEVNIMAAPGITDTNVQMALINHCEDLKDRFAVLDVPENYQEISKVQGQRNIFDSSYSSMYHPWLKVFDPLEKRNIFMPPSGSVIGIYARSDQTRGVHKAPANEVVRGAIDLKYRLNNGEQGILNPDGVNVIRSFPGRGIRVWGARTTSSNTLWKYINVRRLFIYIEESIEEGTQWVVFEPNDEKLWARVRATITQFLSRVWKDGALMGTKAEEAFFVKCDRSTMTQDDIDNGKLICVIGISPVKPAEFVIFRIAQWTGGSSVTE
jgi:phage tail sheath protein FI